MLLINIKSIKSKLDALLYNIVLNDIDICFISETWINTDHYLLLLEANISGQDKKSSINVEKINQEEVLHVYTKDTWIFKLFCYLPISNLSFISKSIEKTALLQLSTYLRIKIY